MTITGRYINGGPWRTSHNWKLHGDFGKFALGEVANSSNWPKSGRALGAVRRMVPICTSLRQRKRAMHYLNHVVIRRRGRSGLNVGDQAWSILIATLCKVHLASHPGVSALGAVSGFWIIGRGDQFCGRWHLLHIAESGLTIASSTNCSSQTRCRRITEGSFGNVGFTPITTLFYRPPTS
jgi:hypothetical protein